MSRLIEGTKVRYQAMDGDQHEYVIAGRENDTLVLESLLVEGRVTRFLRSELQAALAKGRLEFISASGDEEKKLADDLMVFSEEERNKTLRKFRYVTGLIDRGIEYWSPQYIEDLLPAVASALDDPKPPSWRTVCRWHSAYVKAGYSIRGLYSLTSKQGNRNKRIKEEVEVCIKKALDFYCSELRPTKKAAYERLENELEAINGLRRSKNIDTLPVPSYRTLVTRIDNLAPFEEKAGRFGKHKAKIAYNPIAEGVKTSRVMERVCVDHTKLDLFVVDSKTGMPLGRPWLTLAVDEYSRSIVGFYISFRDPDFIVLIKLIRNIVQEKGSVKDDYPFLENEWLCYGIPELFIFDNGKEFWCKDLEIVLAELNIQYAFNPVQHPWFKGKVERKFGAINAELLSKMQGKTFASLAERDDYNPKNNAVIRFSTLIEIFHKWVIDEYQISPTTEKGIIPNVQWNASADEFPPRLEQPDRLNIILGRTEESKLRRGGIYYKKLRYDSEELASYRAKVGDVKACYKVDPDDLSSIYVFNQLVHQYIKVPAVDQSYTQGLNEVQHDIHRTYAKNTTEGNYKHEDVVRARLEIQRRIQEEIDVWTENPKKVAIGASSAAAKYCDVSQDASSSLSEGLPRMDQSEAISPSLVAEKPLPDFEDDELDTSGWRSNVPNAK